MSGVSIDLGDEISYEQKTLLSLLNKQLKDKKTDEQFTESVDSIIAILSSLDKDEDISSTYLNELINSGITSRVKLTSILEYFINTNKISSARELCEKYIGDNELSPIANAYKAILKNITTTENNNDLNKTILFIQDYPTCRTINMARALKNKGYNLSLAFTKELDDETSVLIEELFAKRVKIANYRELWTLIQNYDLVHCHNSPDILSVAALAGGKPVIHDTHELLSLNDTSPNIKYFEGVANHGAHGRIYSSQIQKFNAQKLHGINGASIVIPNYISTNHLVVKKFPKLSAEDKKIHFVYWGPLDKPSMTNNDFYMQFIRLARRGITVHVIPEKYHLEASNIFKPHKNLFYQKPPERSKIVNFLSQFDYGLIPAVEKNSKGNINIEAITPNFFEYISAGLPVAAWQTQVYREFIAENPVGITYDTTEDLINKLTVLREIKKKENLAQSIPGMDDAIGEVEELYTEVLKKIGEVNE